MHPIMSQICLGTAQYGSQLSAKESWRLLDRYTELGGNFIDTAHVYGAWDKAGVNGGAGNSEAVIGQWLQANGQRNSIVIGTKGGHPDFDSKAGRLTEQDVLREFDESLNRLQTDYIDLYWLHRDDRNQPVDQLLGWLEGLLNDGRIKAIGVSNWRADRLTAAQALRSTSNKPLLSASQIAWSLAISNWAYRDGPFGEEVAHDAETQVFHEGTQLPLVAYSSQAGGLFAAKYDALSLTANNFPKPALPDRYGNEATQQRRRVAQGLAEAKGCSTNQIALAYLLHQSFPVHPIVGPRSIDQLEDAMGATTVTLLPAEFQALHEIN